MSQLQHTIQQLQTAFLNYKTETLTFRPFFKSDCFPLFTATQIPGFTDNLLWSVDNQEQLMVECLKLIREHDLKQSVVISACEKDTGKWVGLIKFSIYKDSITMSLWIHPLYWKSRTPIRCAESAIEIAFANSNLPHIYAIIVSGNSTMEKMVLSNSFVECGKITTNHSAGHEIKLTVFNLQRSMWSRRTKVANY